MKSTVSQYGGNATDAIPVYYTAKNINSNPNSRTAINADIAIGDVVVMDPFQHDGASQANAPKPINVTQAQTSFLRTPKYVVVDVPPGVNEIPSSAAPTQRRGGIIWVVQLADDIRVKVVGNDSIAVGGYLTVANGNFGLVHSASAAAGVCAIASETRPAASGTGLTRVAFFGHALL